MAQRYAKERLAHDAVLLELDREGDRLRFEKLQGAGPEKGWLSIRVPLRLTRLSALEMCTTVLKHLVAQRSGANCLSAARLLATKERQGAAAKSYKRHKPRNKETLSAAMGHVRYPYGQEREHAVGHGFGSSRVLQETLRLLKTRFGRIFFCPGSQHLRFHSRIPEIDRGISGAATLECEWNVPSLETTMADYWATKWPQDLRIDDGSVAQELDRLNTPGFAEVLERRDEFHGVVSFSHFVPRIELNPEKRYLIPSTLAKAVGSSHLQKRVQEPCLVWNGSWASRYRSSWAKYYQRYGRQVETTSLVPSVCCNLYTPKITAGSCACRTGWIAGRMPIWLFGPLSSRLQEAQVVIREVRFMAWEMGIRGKDAQGTG
eukprot:Skav219147  [mRNA]  locus=scaffold1574:769190:775357:+ [translate_table: standard]